MPAAPAARVPPVFDPLLGLEAPSEAVLARSALAQKHRLVARERGCGLKVPKSNDTWIAVGLWLASRDFPELPFFLPLVDPATGKRLTLPVPYKTMMATLSPKYNDRDKILLHSRVVQRVDAAGHLWGEVRYLCTDIAVSYQMGDNAFKWVIFHPTIFQVCCNTWNSSLNRGELVDHLSIAYQKGGMVFQAADAEPTRRFLRAILLGKGIRAACTLKPMPPAPLPTGAPAAAATQPSEVAALEAVAAAASSAAVNGSASLQPQCTLQNLPMAVQLFLGALQRTEPWWFHPSLQEQCRMGLDGDALQKAVSSAHAAASDASTAASFDASAAAPAASPAASPSPSMSDLPVSSQEDGDEVEEEGAGGPIDTVASVSAPSVIEALPLSLASAGRSKSGSRKSSSKTKDSAAVALAAAEKPAMLNYVQFVSVPQAATARSPALPCVHICNTLLPETIARDAAAAAAASAAGVVVPPLRKPPTGRKSKPLRRPPPMLPSDDEEVESQVGTIAASAPKRGGSGAAALSSTVSALELLLGSAAKMEGTGQPTDAAAANSSPLQALRATPAATADVAAALAAFADILPEASPVDALAGAPIAPTAAAPPPTVETATELVPSPVDYLELKLKEAAERRRQAADRQREAEQLQRQAAEEEEALLRQLEATRAIVTAKHTPGHHVTPGGPADQAPAETDELVLELESDEPANGVKLED